MGRNKFHIIVLIGLLLIFPGQLVATITLPAIFGNHMVLQQQTDAAIWGKASPGATVKISSSWNNKSATVKADNQGGWKIKIKTPSAGGPYSIVISDGTSLELKDVLIGEVWVCSGQSNMEIQMKGYYNQPIKGSNRNIATSINKNIRLFTAKNDPNFDPQYDFKGNWLECETLNVANFSATAYYFGRMLQEALDVPVGLICASWGGTGIEPWISEQGIKKFNFVKFPDENQKRNIIPHFPGVLFNAMIHPMIGFGIKGVIWYQGESNRGKPDQYLQLMPEIVADWREKWGIGDFPFYYVQIAPFDYGANGFNSAFFREAQLKASSVIPNSGMACLMDIGEKDCVHPSNKEAGGERLAYLALAKSYQKLGFEYSGPVFKKLTVEGHLAYLTFDHASNGLTTFGRKLENFQLSGANNRFYPAEGFITDKGILLYSRWVGSPVAVRYAFEDFVVGELFNAEGLPASSFRSDDWEK